MTINANTKIAAILKGHPDALEAIVAISPKFEKLRNPMLRKLMAGRASIAMASKIAGCNVSAFFEKLKPLGFDIDESTMIATEEKKKIPDFMRDLQKEQLVVLDVRPIIGSGKDPLNIITEKVKGIQIGQVLKIINSFEPVPLMLLLEKQGFAVYADLIDDNLVETYFCKQSKVESYQSTEEKHTASEWGGALNKFQNKLQVIDVKNLEMPLPMLTILEALENLPEDQALFVYHKRIPVFLLPELTERKFDYRINEISDGDVQLLIFKSRDVD
jgi:uncharacterized protein (DUF2249 family)